MWIVFLGAKLLAATVLCLKNFLFSFEDYRWMNFAAGVSFKVSTFSKMGADV